MLTEDQKTVARKLLEERPPVVPGTRAIVDQLQCRAWYNKVTAAMVVLKLKDPNVVNEFCDIAGVAD